MIDSLQYQYIENGASVLSEKHGSNDGHTSAKFTVVSVHFVVNYIFAVKDQNSVLLLFFMDVTAGHT